MVKNIWKSIIRPSQLYLRVPLNRKLTWIWRPWSRLNSYIGKSEIDWLTLRGKINIEKNANKHTNMTINETQSSASSFNSTINKGNHDIIDRDSPIYKDDVITPIRDVIWRNTYITCAGENLGKSPLTEWIVNSFHTWFKLFLQKLRPWMGPLNSVIIWFMWVYFKFEQQVFTHLSVAMNDSENDQSSLSPDHSRYSICIASCVGIFSPPQQNMKKYMYRLNCCFPYVLSKFASKRPFQSL